MIKIILILAMTALGCTTSRDKDELDPSESIYGQLENDQERYEWNSGPLGVRSESPIPMPRQSPMADVPSQRWAMLQQVSTKSKILKAPRRMSKSKKRVLYR